MKYSKPQEEKQQFFFQKLHINIKLENTNIFPGQKKRKKNKEWEWRNKQNNLMKIREKKICTKRGEN